MSYIKKNQPIWVVVAKEENEQKEYTRVVCAFKSAEDGIACINSELSHNYNGFEIYEYQWENKAEFVCRAAYGEERDPDTGEIDITMAHTYVELMCVKCGLV